MGNLQLDIKKILIILFVFSLPILSINMQRKQGISSDIINGVNYFVGVIQKNYVGFSGSIAGTVSNYTNLLDIKQDNRELKSQLTLSQAMVATLSELTIENNRLRQLLDFREKTSMNLITASVIAYDLLIETDSTVRIDRGSKHGLKPYQAVVTSKGIVGYLLKVYRDFSDVLMITDSRSSVDTILQRSRARGIVQGNKTFCILKYLNRSDDVQIDDVVVTSGLDDIFPAGYPVGTVTLVNKKSYGITQEVKLKPHVDPLKLEEVFVVID